MISRLYAVLETRGMLHDHWGSSPRWLYKIPKVSINSVEPGFHAITDLDYDWLMLILQNLSFLSSYSYTSRQFVSVNHIEPGFWTLTDYTMASEGLFHCYQDIFRATHSLTSSSQCNYQCFAVHVIARDVTRTDYSCFGKVTIFTIFFKSYKIFRATRRVVKQKSAGP